MDGVTGQDLDQPSLAGPASLPPSVLVLGATGHIGQAVVRGLLASGVPVRGLARRPSAVTLRLAAVDWRYGDLARLGSSDWASIAAGCAAVVNCAGALQDGLRDDLAAVHTGAVKALMTALPPDTLVVQISAPGVSAQSSTAFYRSKAAGDAALRGSGHPFVILRPVVVVSAEAYGGTALLRAMAGFPGVIPAFRPDSLIQTVALDDVVAAVLAAVDGKIPPGSDLVLAEARPMRLADVLLAFRQWLGLPPAPVIAVPAALASLVSSAADFAGRLGWRSPLRSTALAVTAEGVTGTSGYPCRSLGETLAAIPATVQERWFARLYLMKAAGLLTLSGFWLASGAIGLWQWDAAAATLRDANFPAAGASGLVLLGALADIALGLTVLVRRWVKPALTGMVLLTLAYLASATLWTPGLWADPLGPLVKTIPAALLALVMLAIEPER